MNLPIVIVTALLSAVGARFLPTSTSTDVSVERAAIAAERNALEAEKFRQEFRQEIAALRLQLDSTSDRLNNRLVQLEARSKTTSDH